MGRRVGTKRSDRRWKDEDGTIWASKLESDLYRELSRDQRITIRKCDERDTFDYTTPVRLASCVECGSGKCVQRRQYTPDFYVDVEGAGGDGRGYYIESKGYWRSSARSLLSHFLKCRPDIDLRIIFERDKAATPKLTYIEYATSRLKIPAIVWQGKLPESWTL